MPANELTEHSHCAVLLTKGAAG